MYVLWNWHSVSFDMVYKPKKNHYVRQLAMRFETYVIMLQCSSTVHVAEVKYGRICILFCLITIKSLCAVEFAILTYMYNHVATVN